ncbi:septum formation initiator family protein [Aliiroseovarius sp. PTFE2010]|uniref:septum formation initiator family protein n=1 Tax=Aliiroseovarius sp. PTFE2010 TaxID=3417190 RepID=UPI003CEE6143
MAFFHAAHPRKRPGLGVVVYFVVVFSLGTYFAFASVQGDFGLFRRVQIEAEAAELEAEVQRLDLEIAEMRNKTRRLSDDFLDLDLLDEQARDVLGMIRSDEIVIR